MKKICFDEGDGRERIYKGEMDLEFVSYSPYAYARVQHLSDEVGKDEFILTFDKGENNSIIHNHILVNENPGYTVRDRQFLKKYG
jgi:hypothetical protein